MDHGARRREARQVGDGIGVYLDYAATTPIDPKVLEAMLPYLTTHFGNAASAHPFGRRASFGVERAREELAAILGAEADEIVFTSGATESINLALKGVVRADARHRRHVVVAATEHKAVLDTARALEKDGARVTVLAVDGRGLISLSELKASLSADTALVTVMAANNETGTLGPIAEAAALAHEFGALFLTDGTQLVGKLPIDVHSLDIDLLAFSSHKVYGPKGVGALYVRRGLRDGIVPLFHGGGHEGGLRSGTLNVAGCVGFGHACVLAGAQMGEESGRLGVLRDGLEAGLLDLLPGSRVNGNVGGRLPNITNITFPGVDADSLILAMPDLSVSSGSACSASSPAPSHVLRAMGIGYEAAGQSIRVSLGRFTVPTEIDFAIRRVAEAVEALAMTPAPADVVGANR